MFKLPNLSQNELGLVSLGSGALILVLHLTGVITKSLSAIIFLAAIAMVVFGLYKLDAYNKVLKFFKKKH